jgi:hypothetical protein
LKESKLEELASSLQSTISSLPIKGVFFFTRLNYSSATRLFYHLGVKTFAIVLNYSELHLPDMLESYIDESKDIFQKLKDYGDREQVARFAGSRVLSNQRLVELWILSHVELLKQLFANGNVYFILFSLLFTIFFNFDLLISCRSIQRLQ